MGVIKEVNLQASHEAGWRFQYRGGGHPLPAGISVLTVYAGSQWWNFDCRCEGNNWFCIKGSEWNRFVRKNVKAMITLCSKEEGEDYHRIRMRQRAR